MSDAVEGFRTERRSHLFVRSGIVPSLGRSLIGLAILSLLFPVTSVRGGVASSKLPGLSRQLARLQGEFDRLERRKVNEFNVHERTQLEIRQQSIGSRLRELRKRIRFESSPGTGQVRSSLQKLIESSFPELNNLTLGLYELDSASVFFSSFFSLTNPFLEAGRSYRIGCNLSILDAPPLSPQAREGILAHELAHTLAYRKRNFVRLLGILPIFVSDSSLRKFERGADLEAIERGYAKGLISFRRWLYSRITSRKVERKQKIYLSPEEIEFADRVRQEHPALFHKWRRTPPRSLEEFQEDLLLWESAGDN